jgi:hypothetical protein
MLLIFIRIPVRAALDWDDVFHKIIQRASLKKHYSPFSFGEGKGLRRSKSKVFRDAQNVFV